MRMKIVSLGLGALMALALARVVSAQALWRSALRPVVHNHR